jgi:hypothetical protein
MQAEERHDRHLKERRGKNRPRGKAGSGAQKFAGHRPFLPEDTIAQHCDQFAALQAFADPEQSLRLTRRDDALGKLGGQPMQPPAHLARVALVHDQIDGEASPRLADDSQDLETSKMRAEQQATPVVPAQRLEHLGAMQPDLKSGGVARQDFDPVEQGACERMKVTEHVAVPGGERKRERGNRAKRGAPPERTTRNRGRSGIAALARSGIQG